MNNKPKSITGKMLKKKLKMSINLFKQVVKVNNSMFQM